MNITPIFVLGAPRNGTTWLSNIIGDNQDISSVRHFLHWGNHESNIYRKKKMYGDIATTERFIPFIEQFACTDLFQLASGDKEKLRKSPSRDFYAVYLDLMDNLAEQEGNSFWMTKLDPQFIHDPQAFRSFCALLEERYDDVKFIFIERNAEKVLNSFINFIPSKRNNQRLLMLVYGLKMIARNIAYNVFFKDIIKQNNGICLTYEDLIADYDNQVASIFGYLGMKTAVTRQPDYLKNSSFHKTDRYEFKKWEKTLLLQVARPLLLRLSPLCTLIIRNNKTRSKGAAYYRLHQYKYFKDEWQQEVANLKLDRITYLIHQYDQRLEKNHENTALL